jgi:hypothetical protein
MAFAPSRQKPDCWDSQIATTSIAIAPPPARIHGARPDMDEV